jgi:hypothetical protein
MRVIRHLVAADLRQFRWPLAAWLLIVTLATMMYGRRSLADFDAMTVDPIGVARGFLSVAQALLLFAIVPFVMQSHPAVGSDAFWMTRPISPRGLLISKIVLLGTVMILVPVAARTVLMATHDVPAREILLVAAETALFYTLPIVILMAIAALTPDLWRFVLVCGSILGALAAVLAIAATVLRSRIDDDPTGSMTFGGDDFVQGVLAAGTALTVLLVQYRTRSRARSLPIGVAGLLLAWLISTIWPWPLFQKRAAIPDWARTTSTVRLIADRDTIAAQEAFSFSGRPDPRRSITARIEIQGLPGGWSANIGLFDASVDVDGATLSGSWPRYAMGSGLVIAGGTPPGTVPVLPYPGGAPEVLADVLGVQRVIDPAPGFERTDVVFFLRDSELKQHDHATGRYRGRFWVGLTRHDIEAALPLQAGIVHRNGPHRFVVDRVERTPTGITVLMRQSDATSIFDRQLHPSFAFYLRNRRRDEAVVSSAYRSADDLLAQRWLPFSIGLSEPTSGFSVRGIGMDFPPRYGRPQNRAMLDDEWIAGAELVIVRSMPSGSVQRTLEIVDFPLREASPAAALSGQPAR